MGNRAVITTNEDLTNDVELQYRTDKIGVYVHLNGGYDSIHAFLTYCKMKKYCNPVNNNYGWARLCQVIGNYFGGSLSLGIDTLKHLDCDNYDNGVYLIDDKWNIVGREYFEGSEQQEYNLSEMLMDIDIKQPEDEQLGMTFITDWVANHEGE